MKKHAFDSKKLELRTETLKTLAPDALTAAAGGKATTLQTVATVTTVMTVVTRGEDCFR